MRFAGGPETTTMRLLFLVLMLAGCAASRVGDEETSESRALARQLAERSAGEPQDCAPRFEGQSLHAVDRRTIVYDAPGNLWVSRLEADCPSLRPDSMLVVETFGDRYCRNDLVRAVEHGSSIPGPYCRLGSFTPYRRR
jgi:hypothetical protein